MNSLDYILLAWLGVSALVGFFRGSLAVVGGLVSSLAGLAGALFYRHDLALFLENKFGLQTMLAQSMAERLPQSVLGGSPLDKIVPLLQTMPFVQEKLAATAQMFLAALSFIVLYIIISKGLLVVWKLLQSPFRHGILGGVDRLAGAVLMAGRDLLIMAIVLGISFPFIHSGAVLGIEGLIKAEAVIDQAWLTPYLQLVFANLEKLLGMGA